jgi:hypothetical protein
MVENIRSMLSIENYEWWSEIRLALDEIKKLNELRNAVVHGTWLSADDWDEADLGIPDSRPWGEEEEDEPIWLCIAVAFASSVIPPNGPRLISRFWRKKLSRPLNG